MPYNSNIKQAYKRSPIKTTKGSDALPYNLLLERILPGYRIVENKGEGAMEGILKLFYQ